MVGVAIGVSAAAGLAGSMISGSASKSAAGQQAAAADQAAAMQMAQYQQTRADLQPYNEAGQNNLDLYRDFYKTSADQLGQAFNLAQDHIPQAMTEENLVNTPGYQFNLSQGMRGVANSNAAKGLGVSGPALQGAARYATGLADSTYQNQFNNQQAIYGDYVNQANTKLNQLNSIYGQIGAPVTLGENAAAQSGNIGQQAAANAGSNIAAAGQAQAAGTTAQGQAFANGLNGLGSSGIAYLGVQNSLNGGGGYVDNGTF